ncbi:hypothetical protein C2869_09665 [Saccharobesus litoralis]|uniref:Uncharacterized protein n=1 Tax=Saccharobesus litoralis TaxID=2172099 RepID=A0A2S0VRG7_9ALTE|nr:hypothetical protein [Saccharobesus litoralis]AWB66680.1 hypothetical protein C2869_09665 [Saccharobesus litoralis]
MEYIDQLLTKLTKPSLRFCSSEEVITITELEAISQKYLYSFGDAFKLLIEKGVELHQPLHSKKLGNFYVKKSEAIRHLQSSEQNKFNCLLSISELSKYFCVQPVKIRTMAKLFSWKSIQVNRASAQYPPICIQRFNEHYILLDQWCAQRGYSKASLYRYLLSHNLDCIANQYEQTTKLHIFEKSSKLESVVKQYELNFSKNKRSAAASNDNLARAFSSPQQSSFSLSVA